MMSKTELIQLPRELPMTSEELENYLRDVEKAEIIQPLRADPVAKKNGEIIAIWFTE